MHTQRINLLLTHDVPLALDSLIIPTRSTSTSSSSNEPTPTSARLHFAQVECRRALEQLGQFLRDWCDFAVREKQMYVKFVRFESDPNSSGAHFLILLLSACVCVVYCTVL